jgi:hypothetical protein
MLFMKPFGLDSFSGNSSYGYISYVIYSTIKITDKMCDFSETIGTVCRYEHLCTIYSTLQYSVVHTIATQRKIIPLSWMILMK